jgi:hypothetical protein
MRDFAVHKSNSQPVGIVDRLRVRVRDFAFGHFLPGADYNNF